MHSIHEILNRAGRFAIELCLFIAAAILVAVLTVQIQEWK